MRPVRTWRDALVLIGFLTPAIALIGVFVVAPAVWAVVQSFTNKSLIGPTALDPSFVGFANYSNLLHDGEFYSSLVKTAVFTGVSAILGQTVLGFLIAYLMARRPRWNLRFTPVFAAIFVLPLAAPETVAALAWASLATGTQDGLINQAAYWKRVLTSGDRSAAYNSGNGLAYASWT